MITPASGAGTALATEVDALRVAVIRAAERWLGTPYRSCARVRGAGVDCANFLAAAFEDAGVVEPVRLAPYAPDWHLHRSEEQFLAQIARYCRPLAAAETPAPADIALFRFGRCVSHGALITAPHPEPHTAPPTTRVTVLHALRGRGVVYDEIGAGSALAVRLAGVWTLRDWSATGRPMESRHG